MIGLMNKKVCFNLVKYFKDCWQKYENEKKQKIDTNNNHNSYEESEDRMKNQINELKMIMLSKFESIDRKLEEKFELNNKRLEKIEDKFKS